MLKSIALAGLIMSLAMPALANQTQLARSVGVEPGVYSVAQLAKLRSLQSQGGSQSQINRILQNPQGEALVSRLSTQEDSTQQ